LISFLSYFTLFGSQFREIDN